MSGTTPEPGPRLIDGDFISGLAGGGNRTYQSGLTAHAGGGQSSALALPSVAMVQVDTVASSDDSVKLPLATAGSMILVANAGASTLGVYGSGSDTINGTAGSSEYSIATNVSVLFFCAKAGQWKAIKSA